LLEEVLGDDELQDRITEELESLIGWDTRIVNPTAIVSQRLLQYLLVGKPMTSLGLNLIEQNLTLTISHLEPPPC
jgi:hypothetical protein